MRTFSNEWGRTGNIWIERDEKCVICGQPGPCLATDGSDDEYPIGYLCQLCISGLFKEYEEEEAAEPRVCTQCSAEISPGMGRRAHWLDGSGWICSKCWDSLPRMSAGHPGAKETEGAKIAQGEVLHGAPFSSRCNPIASAVRALMEDHAEWEGTSTELLEKLVGVAEGQKIDTRSGEWPKSAAWLRHRLDRVAANLLDSGISIIYYRSSDLRTILLRRMERSEPETGAVPDVCSGCLKPIPRRDGIQAYWTESGWLCPKCWNEQACLR